MRDNVVIQTIEEQVYRIIRDDIRANIYRPGTYLNESQLAERLNVSRSPVREALKRLRGDGLVKTIPNKGSFVRLFSEKETKEMYEARAMFEEYAVRSLKEPLDETTRGRFLRYKEQFELSLSNEQLYLTIDRAFHSEIVALTRNESIVKLYDQLNWQINYIEENPVRIRTYLEELHSAHLPIIDALVSSRFDELPGLLQNHFMLANKYQRMVYRDPSDYECKYEPRGKRERQIG